MGREEGVRRSRAELHRTDGDRVWKAAPQESWSEVRRKTFRLIKKTY